MNTEFRRFIVMVIMAALTAMPMTARAAGLVATDAKMVLPKKDSVTMPAYVTLENQSSEEIIVIKVRSFSHQTAMIQQAVNDSGVDRMMLRSDLIIKPGKTIKMSSKGVHLMFAGATGKMKKGDEVKVNLYLNNGEKMPVTFKLVK